MSLLAGDTALVTGAANGIGRGIVSALRAEGARVVASDLAETTDHQDYIAADLSTGDGAARLYEAALEHLGRISLFVHCAAPKREERQTALAVSEAEWDRMQSVALRSGFILGQRVGRHMRDRKIAGRMLYVTSLHAETPRNLPHYSAAKAGQTMLVKELARALGPYGIRVNAIAPGAIPGGGFAANVEALNPKIALRRTGTPDDIAASAVALLSDRFTPYVTGTTLAVDGGLGLFNWIEA